MGLFSCLFMVKMKEVFYMDREEKTAVLLTRDQEGKLSKREITQEQLGILFFFMWEHAKKWMKGNADHKTDKT